jgi:hypothetical protein
MASIDDDGNMKLDDWRTLRDLLTRATASSRGGDITWHVFGAAQSACQQRLMAEMFPKEAA